MARQVTLMRRAVELLREWGFKVRYEPGWSKRGYYTFDPHGFLVHHDVSPRHLNWGVFNIVKYGRIDVPGPLANWVLARDGQICALAAGRANHAGRGRVGAFGALRGSTTSWGCEAANDGVSEPWPPEQMLAYWALARACEIVTGYGRNRTIGHKEWAPRRKVDPTFSMPQFRRDMSRVPNDIGIPEEDDEFMRKGDKGPHVRALQQILNQRLAVWNLWRRIHGWPESSWANLKEDGILGDKTLGRASYFLADEQENLKLLDDKIHAASVAKLVEQVARVRSQSYREILRSEQHTHNVWPQDVQAEVEALKAEMHEHTYWPVDVKAEVDTLAEAFEGHTHEG